MVGVFFTLIDRGKKKSLYIAPRNGRYAHGRCAVHAGRPADPGAWHHTSNSKGIPASPFHCSRSSIPVDTIQRPESTHIPSNAIIRSVAAPGKTEDSEPPTRLNHEWSLVISARVYAMVHVLVTQGAK